MANKAQLGLLMALVAIFFGTTFLPPVSVADVYRGEPLARSAQIWGRAQPTGMDAQSSTFAIPLVQYNICSSKCHQNRTATRNVLTYVANSVGAWSVSVNEACIADLFNLASSLGLHGRMVFSIANVNHHNNCPGADKRFGNIIFFKGPLVNATAAYLNNPGVNCAFDECRAAICVRMSTFVGRAVTFSSHFKNQNVPLAQQQAIEFVYIATVFSGTTPQWLAGDFNLTLIPNQVPSYYWNSHTMAVFGNTAPSPSPNRQIDYIWIEGNDINVGYHAPFCPSGASDHCLVYGDRTV